MTVTDLRALSDDELATAYGTADDLERDALGAEGDRRDKAGKDSARSKARWASVSSQWHDGAYAQYLAAETYCRGYMLSREGQAAGVSEWSLWSGPAKTAERHASEELRNWWLDNPRMTVTEYSTCLRADRAPEDANEGLTTMFTDTAPEAPKYATAYAGIEPLPADWLLRDRIPRSELTILAALGGTGKGMWTVDLAARISRGDLLPGDDEAGPAANVILVSTEDDPNVVTVNRLHAAGADMARVFDLSAVNGAPFELPLHAGVLAQAIAEIGNVALVVLDPLAGVAPVSLTSVTKVRGILAPLRQIAHDTGCAIVITHHLTKGREIAGSRAIIDGVRSVLTITRDAADDAIRIVRVAKSNMGAQPGDIRYTITEGPEGAGVTYTGEAEAVLTGPERILKVLAGAPGAVSGQDLAAKAGMPYGSARVLFSRMITAGTIGSAGRGSFANVLQNVTPAPAMTGAERTANHRARAAA